MPFTTSGSDNEKQRLINQAAEDYKRSQQFATGLPEAGMGTPGETPYEASLRAAKIADLNKQLKETQATWGNNPPPAAQNAIAQLQNQLNVTRGGYNIALTDEQNKAAALERQKANFANQQITRAGNLTNQADAYQQQLNDITSGKVQDPALALQNQLNLNQQIAAAKANRSANAALAGRNAAQAAMQTNAIQNAQGVIGARSQAGNFLQNQQSLNQAFNQNKEQQALQRLGIDTQAYQWQKNRDLAEDQQNSNNFWTGVGALTSAGSQLAASSDKNGKSNIKSGNEPAKHFLDALSANSFEYKNPEKPGAGKGRFLGVMAQDLEKAGPVGKSMVQNTENGKIVDMGKGFNAILAAQAMLNERMKKLEGK